MRWGPTLVLLLCTLTASCGGPAGPFDTDGDGSVDADDCGPADPSIHPSAIEAVDGLDNDCDGLIDEGTEASDDDGDGACEGHDYGDGLTCIDGSQPGDCDDTNQGLNINDVDGDEQTTCGGDCDDNNPARLLGAAEVCDGLDNDCDGELALTEQDTDGDGASPCDGDCDDNDDALNVADEDGDGFGTCDGDCDDDDVSLTPEDADGDGWSSCQGDCDDLRQAVHPDQDEACDLVFDGNCDPGDEPVGDAIDDDGDGDPACSDCDDGSLSLNTLDLDGDGYSLCSDPADCDDLVASTSPVQVDVFGDGVDTNCDGADGIDGDGDGWASNATFPDLDCDDGDPTLSPADSDGDGNSTCDGDCDDGDPTLDGLDADGDGITTCAGDCTDDDALVFPGQVETCDLVGDNDCDPSNDPAGDGLDDDGDGDPACSDCDDAIALLHTLDSDADGYTSCVDDCNDLLATIHPGADDPWNDTIDSNCDALDGVDGDQDGYAGNASAPFTDCDDTQASLNLDDTDGDGSTTCDGDCDDADATVEALDSDGDGVTTCDLPIDCDDNQPTVFPGADEICDIFDTDCDPSTTLPDDAEDADGDGWPPCAECDDGDADTWPGAPELCDGQDNDCDGVLMVHGPDGELDNDGDGFADCAGDCNDFDATAFPGAVDDCDGQDTNCDGVVDDLGDSDGDGWCAGDCDDGDPSIYPGQWEDPNDGFDADCDGTDFSGLEWAHITVDGDPEATAGSALAGGGDVDGDIFADVLIGAPGDVYYAPAAIPKACLFRGIDLQSSATIELLDAFACFGMVFHSGYPEVDAGWSVAFLPDIDGDGLDEVVLGAPTYWGVGGHGAALVHLSTNFSGGGQFSIYDADILIEGIGGTRAGESMATGDVDGDGKGDLLLGSSWGGEGWLFLGTTLASVASITSVDADVTFSGAGDQNDMMHVDMHDFDGDGFSDLVFGKPRHDNYTGAVYLFYGYQLEATPAYDMADAHVRIAGAAAGDRAGAVAFVPDVDGDGFGELAIGGFLANGGAGAAWVVDSATLLTVGAHDLSAAWVRIDGATAGTYFGTDVSSAGDLDGDGLGDLVAASAWLPGLTHGGARVFLGSTLAPGGTLLDTDGDFAFATSGNSYFRSTSAGDVNADGAPDLLVGHPTWDWDDKGRAWLLLNPL